MFGPSLAGLNRRKLRLWLFIFFLALLIPTGVLIKQAYTQLKWGVFHQYQVLAEELSGRIDAYLVDLIEQEEARSFSDYSFLVVTGDPSENFLQRSELSNLPVTQKVPGFIGYFQIDAKGVFSTPFLSSLVDDQTSYGLSEDEKRQRLALENRIHSILSENRLVREVKTTESKLEAAPGRGVDQPTEQEVRYSMETESDDLDLGNVASPKTVPGESVQAVQSQAAFDRLKSTKDRQIKMTERKASAGLGRVEDLKLDYRFQEQPVTRQQQSSPVKAGKLKKKRTARKERSASLVPQAPAVIARESIADAVQASRVNINIFENEIDPFEFSLLDSGHFVIFRKVWRNGQRYIQGALIDQQPFLNGVIEKSFRETVLSQMSNLVLAYQGNVFSAYTAQIQRSFIDSSESLGGALLYQTRMSAPLSDFELVYSVAQLPTGAGATLINWVATILMLILCGGMYLFYRLALKQINLGRQQQDFVSAVSHELKTPLTSIRMYGEMLREGWASEEKKKVYYEYIHDESERLSRLIANVLQLARMTRNDLQVQLKPIRVSELLDSIASKISTQVERAGFELQIRDDGTAGSKMLQVDVDGFMQIVINLVDNAIKFSRKAQLKRVDIHCRSQADDTVLFSVRDYGPGIPRDQLNKIFRLFYRSENELTRETVGTGIGLALVKQLISEMHGKVDVINHQPGAEFTILLPVSSSSQAGLV